MLAEKKRTKQKIPQAIRIQVWDRYMGKETRTGNCFAGCNRIIDIADFECGHVLAEAKGGDQSLENLRPLCHLCNRSMGTMNLNEWIEKYKTSDDWVVIAATCSREACKNQVYKLELCNKHYKAYKCITKRCKSAKLEGYEVCRDCLAKRLGKSEACQYLECKTKSLKSSNYCKIHWELTIKHLSDWIGQLEDKQETIRQEIKEAK